MRFDIISIFPEFIHCYLKQGVLAQALARDLIQVNTYTPRDFSTHSHANVDDRPFGGGDGMVMMVEPLTCTLQHVRACYQQAGIERYKTFYLSPQGQPLTQAAVCELSELDGMILLCGRYKGVDQRVLDMAVDEEYSIGDYVVSGGELGALVLMDAVARHCPDVLGNEESAQNDSFMHGMLDAPHYTRPREYLGRSVPPVLLSGDAKNIQRWRLKQMLGRTFERRPDLFKKLSLDDTHKELLEEYLKERQTDSHTNEI